MAVPNCPRCGQVISSEDTLAFSGDKIFHLDCHRPHDLSPEERAVLFRYCHDHVVAKCFACAASFPQQDLGADLIASRSNQCPRCRADLTASMRAHLYTCAVVPHEIRLTAQAVRDAARILVQQSGEQGERADVLLRVAEVAMVKLRETMARVAATERRREKDRGIGSM
jgi:DNA-directed RNA polymerase subunit RPC12/RpoP